MVNRNAQLYSCVVNLFQENMLQDQLCCIIIFEMEGACKKDTENVTYIKL